MNPTTTTALRKILASLHAHANPANVAGMARYGIVSRHVLGIPMPWLRSLAKEHGRDHELALVLWGSGILEARILAALIGDPARLTARQMDRWAKDFDNWAVCDGVCIHLLRKTPQAHAQAVRWSARREEFVRRAGFTMMATLAVHDHQAGDATFRRYLTLVASAADDGRNGVKKAVNWALRQIGKRNLRLHAAASRIAQALRKTSSPSARWIAADALRELRSPAVLRRLKKNAR